MSKETMSAYEQAMLEAQREQTAVTRQLVEQQLKANELAAGRARAEDSNEKQMGLRMQAKQEAFNAEHAEAAPVREVPVIIPNCPLPEECHGEGPNSFDIRTTLFVQGITRSDIARCQPDAVPPKGKPDVRYRNAKVGQSKVTHAWTPAGPIDLTEAEAAIRNFVRGLVKASHDELVAAGRVRDADELYAGCEGHTVGENTRGVDWWRMRFLAAVQTKVIGRVLEDLVRDGVVKLVEPEAAAAE